MQAWIDRAPRALLHALAITLVLGLASGCGIFSPEESTDDDGGGGTAVEFPPAETPQQLIENFTNAYENLNIIEYEKALHPQFTFWFAPQEIDAVGAASWDRATDVQSTERMFEGQLGSRIGENGEPETVPAVQSIDLQLNPREPWTNDFDDGAEFAEADFRGGFDVTMTVRYTDSALISQVAGQQRFYIKLVDMEIDGQTRQVYQIYAWKDFGNPNS